MVQLVQRVDTSGDLVEAAQLPIQDLVEAGPLGVADEPPQTAPQHRLGALQPSDPHDEEDDRDRERDDHERQRPFVERHRGGA